MVLSHIANSIEILDIGNLDRTLVRRDVPAPTMPQRRTARDLTRYQLVGQLLAEIRRLMGLSQEDVAAGVGRPQSFISTIEAGQHRVDIVELIDLANVVGFDPAELITRMRKAAQKQENPNQGKLF